MINKLILVLLIKIFTFSTAYAKHQNEPYGNIFSSDKFEVKGSNSFLKFNSDLIKDKNVIREIKNKDKTRLISYLLYENNQIIIDEHDIPSYIKNNKGLLPSHSVGKSLVSYVTGYAICEGYIDNVDVKLIDWPVLKGTLYEGQKLIDLLNMRAGDQEIIGEKKYKSDNRLEDAINVNLYPIKNIMESDILQSTKKSKKLVYNYNALATNTIMNYTIFKVGDDYQNLLNKVFKEDAKIKNSVFFAKTLRPGSYNVGGQNGRYSFYADRYDYLRIAVAVMNHWNNDTCVGKYLKEMYERRINKNRRNFEGDRQGQFSVSQYTKKYGGQFHFDIVSFSLTNKKILGMDGFGGQQIIIDFEKGRIIVVNSIDRHYNWKKIVLEKLKQ
tara:strand:+ start:394 stop:1545 length:1152 start_codon:yes stop_codon:yes gene_type:complete